MTAGDRNRSVPRGVGETERIHLPMRRKALRRALLLLCVLGSALWVAGPAQAKGTEGDVTAESVSITGSGISVRLIGDDAASYGDLSNTFSPSSRMAGRPANVDLGPRYAVSYWITCQLPNGSTAFAVINQSLFPYARYRSLAQVWSFTPPGQPSCGSLQAPAAGWVASRRGLFDVLSAAGLPAAPPAAIPAQPLAPLAGGPAFAWYALVMVGGLVALLGVGAVTRRRIRARASP